MVTWFKALCAGGGNVTFGVYIWSGRFIDVCSALGVFTTSVWVVLTMHA